MWKKYGRAVRRKPGEMNKLEAEYAERLKDEIQLGSIAWFSFDAIKLRLAASCFYTPDFIVINGCSEIEVHEVKGHWEDDARVKIKVAAAQFPFRFKALTKKKGIWIEEAF